MLLLKPFWMFNLSNVLSISDNIASQLGYITRGHFIYKNKTQSLAIKLDKSNVFLFCYMV